MSYSVLYEFRDTDGNGTAEAVISRYNNGDVVNSAPNVVVTAYANTANGKYDMVTGVDDVEGDGDIDEDDDSYYTLAADLASALVGLSNVGAGRLYRCILISFGENTSGSKLADVNIGLFNVANSDLTRPNSVVTVTGYAKGLYTKVLRSTDADGDGDIDLDDEFIFRKIAGSFASMRDFKV
ncbi:hypothetical protein PSH79_00435 [Pseudomonas sp. FP2196]|uniref:hypothetical protein n=1 Tax=Pseudomonas sp. FP2196 TaxID=2954086 RepID=UPI002736A196|nr:hypothetical protein [Pseudomonas sp. FP2196]WLH35798.1 hypothetical protein PSH79_00435 [Pseudomonas sp. FP2196]